MKSIQMYPSRTNVASLLSLLSNKKERKELPYCPQSQQTLQFDDIKIFTIKVSFPSLLGTNSKQYQSLIFHRSLSLCPPFYTVVFYVHVVQLNIFKILQNSDIIQ